MSWMGYKKRKEEQLQLVSHQVKKILEENFAARNNDTVLTCIWLREYCGVSTVRGIEINSDRISFESIRRARQKIQAAGLFLPTDETVIKRRKLQQVYEQVMRRDSDGTN